MSLFDTAERFASIDRSQLVFRPERCLYSQDAASTCTACLEVCPVNAITPGKPPVLDAEKCQSCLACLPVCPVGAYTADDDVASLLNCTAHLENKSVELLCSSNPDSGMGIQADSVGIRIKGCLAGLGAGAYGLLLALGLEKIILRTDACSACKWGSLSGKIVSQAEHAERLFAAWEPGGRIISLDRLETSFERPVWDVNNPPLSRRDLFRMLARQGQVAMARAMENGVSASKRQPGRDRMRILSAVSHFPEPVSGAMVNLDGFGFATLNIDEGCTACGACAKTCPTTALIFEKNQDETRFTLTFSPGKCIGCDLCNHVCAPGVITIDHAPIFENIFGQKKPLLLQEGELVHCERCQSLMVVRPGERFCTLCEYRRAHPFGSILPAELKAQMKKVSGELHS